VYVNGQLEIPGCPTCGGRIDLQKFISAVTVDPGVDPVASASITMHIPRASDHAFYRDGQFVLTTGLEINIYMRGYFPAQGQFGNITEEQSGGINIQQATAYPYYHVFHGVVTEVSHEYSGGEHTASLNCNDMLHFWNYQRMATSGAHFAKRSTNSKVNTTMVGHTFTKMTPYAIMYSLFKSVVGAQGGVGTTMRGTQSNAAVDSTATSESMWEFHILYWEKRFSQHFNNLRMYGVNGTLYNAFQQAFLGRLSTKESNRLVTTFADPTLKTDEHDPLSNLAAAARELGYDPASTFAGQAAEANAERGGMGLNINEMQAFVWDVGQTGNVNFWETEYQTKMDMAQTLSDLTGFEFFQDVDGDFVFKPPFYNLDTSSSRVYVIEDIDIISFSVSDSEPEATAVKATSEAFKNIGLGLGGEMGNRAEFIDHRLVAKYGWRQQTFETAYFSDARAMYYACVNRMDLYNIGIKKASCQIPVRAELRPGYPLYVRYLDCFFYLQSFSHSHTFGGQCTTSLNLVGRRAKFHAPGKRPEDGSEPTVLDTKLSDPWFPALPLQVTGNDGIPRLQGFPNVVLALDTELLNPNFYVAGILLTDLSTEKGLQSLIRKAREYGVLELDDSETGNKSEKEKWLTGPFLLRTGDDTVIKIGSARDLLSQAQDFQAAYNEVESGSQLAAAPIVLEEALRESEQLRQVIEAVRERTGTAIDNRDNASNYFDLLNDLRASFNPGKNMPGYYRYYSSSHPSPDQQGMKDIVADEETVGTTQAGGLIYLESPTTAFGFQSVDGSNEMANIQVTAGLPIMRPNTGQRDARAVPTPTHQIGTIAFAQHRVRKEIKVPRVSGKRNPNFSRKTANAVMYPNLRQTAEYSGFGSTVRERFEDLYNEYRTAIAENIEAIRPSSFVPENIPTFDEALSSVQVSQGRSRVPLDFDGTLEDQYRDPDKGLQSLAKTLSQTLAKYSSGAYAAMYEILVGEYGKPGNNRSLGSLGAGQEGSEEFLKAKDVAFTDLYQFWGRLIQELSLGQVASPMDDSTGGLVVYTPSYETVPVYTPVFPVSDERGYEVIGSYRYGRGLSIEASGNLQLLVESNPFENVSVAAVEAFVAELENTGNVSLALGTLASQNPDAASQLVLAASQNVVGETGQSLGTAILEVQQDPDLFGNSFRNYIANSKEFSQKTSPTNAAFGLADLGLLTSRQVCECKGAEADVLLAAFGAQEFVSVDQPDEPSAWVADQMLLQAPLWQTSQSSLRGQILDGNRSSMADAFKAYGNQVGDLARGIPTTVVASTTDLEEAGQQVADEVADFTPEEG